MKTQENFDLPGDVSYGYVFCYVEEDNQNPDDRKIIVPADAINSYD